MTVRPERKRLGKEPIRTGPFRPTHGGPFSAQISLFNANEMAPVMVFASCLFTPFFSAESSNRGAGRSS